MKRMVVGEDGWWRGWLVKSSWLKGWLLERMVGGEDGC